jgi:hypothetical protein
MVKKGSTQPSRALSGGSGESSDDDIGSAAPSHAQLSENLTRVGSQDALVQSEALVSLHIFISTVYTQGGGASLPHPDILQAVVPLLSHPTMALPTHVVVAQILRTVADNAGEDVCDALASSPAIPSVVANIVRALATPNPDVSALCSDYFFFLASLCDCRHVAPPSASTSIPCTSHLAAQPHSCLRRKLALHSATALSCDRLCHCPSRGPPRGCRSVAPIATRPVSRPHPVLHPPHARPFPLNRALQLRRQPLRLPPPRRHGSSRLHFHNSLSACCPLCARTECMHHRLCCRSHSRLPCRSAAGAAGSVCN